MLLIPSEYPRLLPYQDQVLLIKCFSW